MVRDSALAEDLSGCSRMSGVLSKKSPHGIWQKRFFCLNNEYMVYRAADADPTGPAIKGAVDLAEVVAVVASGNSLTLKTTGDRDFALQASSADQAAAWAVALEERRRWLAGAASADELAEAAAAVDSSQSRGSVYSSRESTVDAARGSSPDHSHRLRPTQLDCSAIDLPAIMFEIL